MPEAAERGVLARPRVGVVRVVLADPAVLGEAGRARAVRRAREVVGVAALVVPADVEVDVQRQRHPVAVEVLLARDRRAPRRDAAGAVADRAPDLARGAADERIARERPGHREARALDLRRVDLAAVDAGVVLRRRDDAPDPVAAALHVQDRVADRLALDLDLLLRLARGDAGGVRLEAVLVEGPVVLVVHEQDPLVAPPQREVGEEVVVEPELELVALRVAVLVAPRDQDVGAVARGHLEAVGRRRRDRVEVGEARAPVRAGGAAQQPRTVERVGGGTGGRDAADERAPRRAGEPAGQLLGLHCVPLMSL